MKIHEVNSETSYVIDSIAPRIAHQQITILKEKYLNSLRRRHRFCFHQNPDVDLHDIIICYDQTSYIPPNKHVGKVESLLVLSGMIDLYFFNDAGAPYDHRRLSTPDSGLPFYIRIPPNTWHGLRAVGSTPCIIKETISGPYDRSTLQWAGFAPTEADGVNEGFKWYDLVEAECTKKKISSPVDEIYEQISDTVFRSSRQIVTVNRRQLDPLFLAAKASPLRRARLCCHGSSEEKLQEMFIALAQGVDIEESIHLRKDESLTVIEGDGTYLFPNEDGSLRDSATLSPFDAQGDISKNFFVRINRYVPHKIIVASDFLLIHEATNGPFYKEDTDYRIKRADQ